MEQYIFLQFEGWKFSQGYSFSPRRSSVAESFPGEYRTLFVDQLCTLTSPRECDRWMRTAICEPYMAEQSTHCLPIFVDFTSMLASEYRGGACYREHPRPSFFELDSVRTNQSLHPSGLVNLYLPCLGRRKLTWSDHCKSFILWTSRAFRDKASLHDTPQK